MVSGSRATTFLGSGVFYSGVDGSGPKKAEAILDGTRNITEMWRAVLATYKSHGLTEGDALLPARLAHILRREDYDKEKGLIYLWHPLSQERPTLSLNVSLE